MALSLQLIVLLGVSTGLWIGADACPPVCHPGWTGFGSHCYVFHHGAMAWADAEKYCTTIGGNLASVHSKEVYEHLRSMTMQLTGENMASWLGGCDAAKEGIWLWSDGSLFDFKFWAKGEPNNWAGKENCMEMNFRGKDFVNDNNCAVKKSFFCAKHV